MFCNV